MGMDGEQAPKSQVDANGTTEEDVYEALEEVIDPELGLDFVSLGLVYDVEIENGEVFITFTLTTPACPIGPQVSEQMREFVGELQGVEKVHPKMVFDPPWSPEMMSEDAKFALGYEPANPHVFRKPGPELVPAGSPFALVDAPSDAGDLEKRPFAWKAAVSSLDTGRPRHFRGPSLFDREGWASPILRLSTEWSGVRLGGRGVSIGRSRCPRSSRFVRTCHRRCRSSSPLAVRFLGPGRRRAHRPG